MSSHFGQVNGVTLGITGVGVGACVGVGEGEGLGDGDGQTVKVARLSSTNSEYSNTAEVLRKKQRESESKELYTMSTAFTFNMNFSSYLVSTFSPSKMNLRSILLA